MNARSGVNPLLCLRFHGKWAENSGTESASSVAGAQETAGMTRVPGEGPAGIGTEGQAVWWG
jgi:hypothetical protein